MIDPIQIKQEVTKGKLKFWIEGEILYCSDTSPATTTVVIPYSDEAANDRPITTKSFGGNGGGGGGGNPELIKSK